jgi:membrane protein implicated in regulation of membrane protease activity
MHIVAVAWIFVVVLMALAEGTSPQGTWLGAFFTLLLYGVLPLSIVLYVMGTPMRRRARRASETAEAAGVSPASADPDGGRQPAGDPLAPERKEP